jgi:hypothetical protein
VEIKASGGCVHSRSLARRQTRAISRSSNVSMMSPALRSE